MAVQFDLVPLRQDLNAHFSITALPELSPEGAERTGDQPTTVTFDIVALRDNLDAELEWSDMGCTSSEVGAVDSEIIDTFPAKFARKSTSLKHVKPKSRESAMGCSSSEPVTSKGRRTGSIAPDQASASIQRSQRRGRRSRHSSQLLEVSSEAGSSSLGLSSIVEVEDLSGIVVGQAFPDWDAHTAAEEGEALDLREIPPLLAHAAAEDDEFFTFGFTSSGTRSSPMSATSSQSTCASWQLAAEVPKNTKKCVCCGEAYMGFGATCGLCRKLGISRGGSRQCLTCGDFSVSFKSWCTDCCVDDAVGI